MVWWSFLRIINVNKYFEWALVGVLFCGCAGLDYQDVRPLNDLKFSKNRVVLTFVASVINSGAAFLKQTKISTFAMPMVNDQTIYPAI